MSRPRALLPDVSVAHAANAGSLTTAELVAQADGSRILAPIYRRGDRWMAGLVGAHLLLALGLARVHDTWPTTLWIGGGAAVAYWLAWRLWPGRFRTRALAGVVLQLFCALHIHQMQGLAEMHFFFFTSVTALIVYQDWVAIWPGVLAIIAQHTLFALGHNEGVHPGGVRFFESAMVSPAKLSLHFGIALAQTAIASWAAHALRERTLADGERQRRLALASAAADRARDEAELAREEAERRRAEADDANRAKSAFLATMSHELRTPLNAIAGHVQLLDMGLHGPVTPAQHEALARVQRSQRHLLGLINDVLNFARLEAGRVEFTLADVDLAAAAHDAVPMVEPLAVARGLSLDVLVPDDAPLARADREKVQQILLNLLSNAVKFTRPGGRIAVLLDATHDADGTPRLHLRVRDTGVGIPADRLEAIFDPFVQLDARLAREQEGTGLGLAISRDLARGMDGDLVAESTPGAGSTFTLVLPAAQPAAGAAPRALPAIAAAAAAPLVAGTA